MRHYKVRNAYSSHAQIILVSLKADPARAEHRGTPALPDIWDQIDPAFGACAMLFSKCSSIPGFSLLDANSSSSSWGNQTVSGHCQIPLDGQNRPQLKTTGPEEATRFDSH